MVSLKEQAIINTFKRTYFSSHYRSDVNTLSFSNTTKKHQDMVYEICWWLYKQEIPFFTTVKMKSGYCPDIVVPFGLPKKIIEVRHSEKEKQTRLKDVRIPEDLKDEIVYVDASKIFDPKMIL
jgi:hypothetical protein